MMASSNENQHCRTFCFQHPDASLIGDRISGEMVCWECNTVPGRAVIDVSEGVILAGDPKDTPLSGNDPSVIVKHIAEPGKDDLELSNRKSSLNSADKVLIGAFREISTMAGRINLPVNIIDRANKLFKQVYESKCVKKQANDTISAACLYIACRQEGVPRTLKEIGAISNISKTEIGRSFTRILNSLKTSVDLIKSGDFLSRFCSNLDLPSDVQSAATHIAKKAVSLDLVPGRSPITLAAAAIYMASQASEESRSQKGISRVTGTAEATIRMTYKLMYPEAAKLFPPDFEFHVPIEELPAS